MTSPTTPSSFLATRRGKLTLALLCGVAFLDFVDASIVNIALPSIRRELHFSVSGLQWVPSGYLLTYGGFMLLGGRAADLLGRRRVLVSGVMLIGVSSLVGGVAGSSGVFVAARMAQGLGAAMTLPAALSILTTSFKEGKDRNTALGVWGGLAGLASAVGVLLGGLLTEGPGWRWVMFVNPIAVMLVLGGIYKLIADDRRSARFANFDVLGAVLATGGVVLLVDTLVKAPIVGWGKPRTIAELAGALALLAAFVANELRHRNPLTPLSIFRINGLGFSNVTQLIAFAGLLAMFFYLTLYMQTVLGYSAIQTGAAYLPLCFAIGTAAGDLISAALPDRDPAGDRRRCGDRRRRHVLAVQDPGRRVLPLRPASGHVGALVRRRADVRRGQHRGQRRRTSRQGGARRVAAQRLPTGRRRARAGDLHRRCHQPHQPSARGAHTGRARPHIRLPASAARRKHPDPRLRRARGASDEHPRRGTPSRRERPPRARPSMTNATAPALDSSPRRQAQGA